MSHPKYSKYETEFLESTAAKLGLTGEYKTCFTLRTSSKYDKYNANTILAKDKKFLQELYVNYQEDDFDWHKKQALDLLKETLRKTKPVIEQNNWQYQRKPIKSWKDLINFLRNDYFPQWYGELLKSQPQGIKELWQQLWDKVNVPEGIAFIDKSVPVLAGPDLSAMQGKKQKPLPKFDSRESRLVYQFELERSGYLILLEKSPDELMCFSPSNLVMGFHHNAGEHTFPYIDNPYSLEYIPLKEGVRGTEEVVAILSQTKPNFDWLQSAEEPPIALDSSKLIELLEFLETEAEWEIMSGAYQIVA